MKLLVFLMAMLIVFFGLVVSMLVFLIIISPGKPNVFKDNNVNILNESISEKIFVAIGGVKQGMFIRSKSIDNPDLLFF